MSICETCKSVTSVASHCDDCLYAKEMAERARCAAIVKKYMPLSHTKAAILLEIEEPAIESAAKGGEQDE